MRRDRGQQVLAVVEHEQRLPVAQVLDEAVLERQVLALLDVERRPRPRRRSHRRRARARARRRTPRRRTSCHSSRATRIASRVLPTPPGPVSVTRRSRRDEAHDRVEVVARGRRGACVSTRRRRGPPAVPRSPRRLAELERRVLVEACAVRARGAPATARVPTRRGSWARIASARRSASVGRPLRYRPTHQLRPQALAQRVRDDERLQRADRGRCVTEREQRLDEILLGRRPQLVEPHGLAARPVVVRELGERRTVPQVERGLERRDRHRARGRPAPGSRAPESRTADRAAAADATRRSNSSASTRFGRDLEHVAGRPGDDLARRVRGSGAAARRGSGAPRGARLGWSSPQSSSHSRSVETTEPRRASRSGEEQPGFGAADRLRDTVPPRLDRPEHPELEAVVHATSLADRACSPLAERARTPGTGS